MNPVLLIIYHLLKTIVRVSLRIFYRQTYVRGRDRLRLPGPLIVLSNHPSTVMDPFNVVARVKNEVYFLANASLFKNPIVGRILNTLYCIKVERYQDVQSRPLRNDWAFEQSITFLARKGTLYIAPEGTSEVERRLRKIKTGTARIALAAEAAHNFSLGLCILPVGINYSDPTAFRSDVQVDAGHPIRVQDFADHYRRDEWGAVQALTEAIRQGLSDQIVDTADVPEEEALRALEVVAQTEGPIPFRKQPDRSRRLLEQLRESKAHWGLLRQYTQFLERNKVSDSAVADRDLRDRELVGFILGFPLALYGALNHLLPCGLPWFINRRFNVWPCYEATFKYVSGLVLFPLFYYLQIRAVSVLTDWWWLYAISLPVSGWWLDRSWRFWERWRAARRWERIQAGLPALGRGMQDRRNRIVDLLKQWS